MSNTNQTFTPINMKNRAFLAILFSMFLSTAIGQNSELSQKMFNAPEKRHYPETWFHFIGNHVTLEGITSDLEAIADAKISGVQFFHGSGHRRVIWPDAEVGILPLSKNWDNAVQHIAKECRRLDLRFTMQNCPGWAMAGGPWVAPENAMRGLVMSRSKAEGKIIDIELSQPQPSKEPWRDYRDIAVLAFSTPAGDCETPIAIRDINGTEGVNWEKVFSKSRERGTLPPSELPYIAELDFVEPSVVRSIVLPSVQSMNHAMSYEPKVVVKATVYTADGKSHVIANLPLPASNWQDNDPLTIACPEVQNAISCKMEFMVSGAKIRLRDIKLYSAAMKNSWESEAGLTLRAFERTADDVVQSKEAYIASSEILDISNCMQPNGHLVWSAPNDKSWTILRIGHVNEGKKNGPAPAEGTGWECDKLSTAGPDAHFKGYIGRLTDGALKGGQLDGMLLDSWECSTQMWTKEMESAFSKRCGYGVRSWLPALFGYVVEEPEITSKFLLDWRGTINDLIVNNFFKRMAELGHKKGLSVTYETAGGDVVPIDIMEYFKYADTPMCEFWTPFTYGYVGSLNFKPIKPTASASHLYGKNRTAAESFTSFNLTWKETPQFFKEFADYHFVEGVTHNVFHTYTHNPDAERLKPGTSFGGGIGSPFLQGQTWWPYMKHFSTYLARCSYMLESGRPVADVLWYLGDEISHKPDQEYNFPQGFKFDYCNPDILLNRLSVKDGKIVSMEGLEYALLWVPENKRMRPESVERLYELVKEGAIVVAMPPKGMATLIGGKEGIKRFDKAVANLWGNSAEGDIVKIGKGQLLHSNNLEIALKNFGLKPSVLGRVRWIQREDTDRVWYFITPEKQSSFNGSVSLKAEGCVELWNPVSGEVKPLKARFEDGYATIELDLPKAGSCFVVVDKSKKHQNPNERTTTSQISLSDNWRISFPKGWGVAKQFTLDTLKPWHSMDISTEGKHFSGKVTYKRTFVINKECVGKLATLDLGRVESIAEVRVNGKYVATLWCAPYSLDIGSYLKSGKNTIEIDVISSWHNRLVYDASQPEDERKSWVISGPKANAKLVDNGLLGPVKLKF